MILYFSATGNSEYAARYLAKCLDDPDVVSLTPYIRAGKGGRFCSERPYVILSPVYVSTIPEAVRRTLMRCRFEGNRSVYFLMTCVGEISASGYYAEKFCRSKRLRYMGCAHLSMPQNYLIYFHTRPDAENRKKGRKAMETVSALAGQIRRGERLTGKRPGRLHVLVVRPVEPLFSRFLIRPERFWTNERCISCGICEKVCPLGNIRMENGKPVWGFSCMHCTACINRCPREAVEYGRLTKGKIRYHAPKFKRERDL